MLLAASAAVLACLVSAAAADELLLLRANPDPYGYPRPAPGETDVPLATSLFFEIGFKDKNSTDTVHAESLAVRIAAQGGPPIDVLKPGRRFAAGYSGRISPGNRGKAALVVYIDGGPGLEPSTTYTVSVTARSQGGAALEGSQASWQFTTETPPATHALRFSLDLSTPSIRWHGGFFTGFCKPSFCTSASNRIPGYELMNAIRRGKGDRSNLCEAPGGPFRQIGPVPFSAPNAWSLQRDFWLTGMQHQPTFLSGGLPNVVRERETRRVVAIEKRDAGTLLRVEDFFGHEQYGIASGRPISSDYHPGDEVLIADGTNHRTAKVLAIVEDTPGAKSLLVTPVEEPSGGWKIDYARPLPEKEDPNAPGLFPPGGCYLVKLKPPGTPHYYWGRVDKEWDIAVRRFGRRLAVNFADAPGDLAVDGENWTYAKDYAELHEVVRTMTGHLIDRYGDASLDFVWSVFNEPDLAAAFWRSGDWNELQKFYDYTADAILRSFEDHGYDSRRVIVGGLEIGAIFGTHFEGPIMKIFLSHCSPTATCPGALEQNAAVADRRLDGKRSKRVEDLCRAAGGKGSPCDFVSVHSYNASDMMAAKLARAKQLALEIDADYYANLWVDSFESCPDWAPPPDVAAADSYLGNGYFPTWCADVARRRLAKAAEDPRYAFGETILTFWPWPNSNFGGHNGGTRVISIDEDGDGKPDRRQTVAMPILNFLGLMAAMGDDYLVLPERTVGGHVVSGFAAAGDDAVRVLLYSHNPRDTQARSEASFEIALDLAGAGWPKVRVSQYRFDKDHNSYYHLARQLRDRGSAGGPSADETEKLVADLASGDRRLQIVAVKKAARFAEIPQAVLAAALQLYNRTEDQEVRSAIEEAARKIERGPTCYRPEEVARIAELSTMRATAQSTRAVGPDGVLHLPLTMAAGGANFVVIKPAAP